MSLNLFFSVGWSPKHQQGLIVRVGYYENPPKLFRDAEGNIQGFWPDLVNAIAEEEGWTIQWVPGTWEENLARLEKGEIDIMPDVAWNQQRSLIYQFTETKVLVSWSRLYAKKGADIETILDLEDKIVAGLKGSVNYDGAEGIKDLVQQFDINVTFVDLDSYTEVFEAIQNGTVDAGITNKDFGNRNERNFSNLERTAFVFQPAYITFAFPRNGKLTPRLLEAIDEDLRTFKADNNSVYYRSLGRYLEDEAATTETVISSIPSWVKDGALVGGGLILLFLFTSVITRREVQRKTVELEQKIQERQQAETALQIAEQDYRTIFENAPIGIFQSTPEGRFRKVNSTMAKMYGYASPDEMLESVTNISRQIHPDDASRQEFLNLMSERGEVVDYEKKNLRKDGSIIWTSTNARTVQDESNRIIYYEGFIRDITERNQFEEERENLITELTVKNTELEHFIYTVSHDLKSPLVTMKGFLGYLEQDAINGNVERLKTDTQRISNAVEKMQQLLGDLLELSRIGRFINPLEKIHFEELARDAISLVEGQIMEHNVKVELQPDLPEVYGDKLRLVEVLQNLIDNAIKYMDDQAQPHIEIGYNSKNADGDQHAFFVKDNGIGIAPEYLERVFGLFNKLDARTEGTGVGLALVKRIIELHGGQVWVESELGQGSIFYFTLPAA